MSKLFKPFTSTLTEELLNHDKYIGEMRSLLRGHGPPYTPRDIMNIKKVMLMRLNADDSKSYAQIFFIISLTESLINPDTSPIPIPPDIKPLDILERVLPIIHGVNDYNVEQLLQLWITNPDQAELILTAAAATPSETPVLRPITPQHQKWINDCNSMLDHIFFSTKNFPVAPVARSGSAAVMESAPTRSRPTSMVVPTFPESTSITKKIADLTTRRNTARGPIEKHVFQTRINQLLKELGELGKKDGGRKKYKKQSYKKWSTKKKQSTKKRSYKKRSKSIKRKAGGGRLPIFQQLAQGQGVSQDTDPDFWRRRQIINLTSREQQRREEKNEWSGKDTDTGSEYDTDTE